MNFDCSPFTWLFEEALADYIQEWQKNGKSPYENIEQVKADANELSAIIYNDMPCWQKTDKIPENGLFQTATGMALVQDGYFVMLEDLIARLPRAIDEDEL